MDNKLKILFLSNRIPFPIKDGHSRRTYHILKGLSEKHEVYFLSLYETAQEIEPQIIQHLRGFCNDVEVFASPSKKFSFPMVLRLLRSLFSIDPYTIWRHYSPPYLKRIQKLVKMMKFDLIHCDILPLSYTVQNINTIPRTITNHDVCYLKALRMSKQSHNLPLKLFLYFESQKLKMFESKIFEQMDMGLTVSEVDKNLLTELCPEGNFVVVENGVDTNKFKPLLTDIEPNTLLWVGGFGYSPNKEAIYFFLENIYPLIKKDVSDVKLNLVGGGITEKLNNISSYDPSITIFGYVDDPIPYIQRATVFIVPILSGSGTRLKTLEAMAAEKAIVTTSVGCEGIEGIDKIHYLIADKPADFAKCVIDLLNDSDLRKALGINARKLATQKYDWGIILEKLNNIYKTLKIN